MTLVVMEIYGGDGNADGGEKLPRWLLFLNKEPATGDGLTR